MSFKNVGQIYSALIDVEKTTNLETGRTLEIDDE